MANPLDNPILIDGTMILDETLGSYAKSSLNTYNPSYYVSLGSWSDTLGVIIEDENNSTIDSSNTNINDTSEIIKSTLNKLKLLGEELLSNLSNKLIEFSWVIPDNYFIEFIPVVKLNYVYLIPYSNSEQNFSILTKITLGKARIKFVTEFNLSNIDSGLNSLKEKLTLLFNGVILFLSSGISPKE